MVKGAGLELPPPGAGLTTVTEATPFAATSLAGIWASAVLESTTVVGRSPPFHRTTELATKFAPDTRRFKPGPPPNAPPGSSTLIAGMGFGPLVTVKFRELDVPPPGVGLVTVTVILPAEEMVSAGIAAVICVALTNFVAGAVPPKLTAEDETKFVPINVRVKGAPPACAPLGEIVAIVGTGFVGAGFGPGDGALARPSQPIRSARLAIPAIKTALINNGVLFMTPSSMFCFSDSCQLSHALWLAGQLLSRTHPKIVAAKAAGTIRIKH